MTADWFADPNAACAAPNAAAAAPVADGCSSAGPSGVPDDTAGAIAEALRYGRRCSDLSQRELADAVGLSSTMVGRAEMGDESLPLRAIDTLLRHLGLRLAVVDSAGEVRVLASSHELVDRAGRHYPAHLDLRVVDEWSSWWGDLHDGSYVVGYNPRRPRFTFDQRSRRDDRREWERWRALRRRALRDGNAAPSEDI